MRQHPDPDPDNYEDEDLDRYHDGDEEDLEDLGTPVYQGSGLSVRALTAEELQRFLDAHHDQPGEPLGSGWTTLDPPAHPLGGPRTPPAATLPVPAGPPIGAAGHDLCARAAPPAARQAGRQAYLRWLHPTSGRRPGDRFL